MVVHAFLVQPLRCGDFKNSRPFGLHDPGILLELDLEGTVKDLLTLFANEEFMSGSVCMSLWMMMYFHFLL